MLFSFIMEIGEHKKKFDEIVKKYNLSEEDRAKEIVEYLIKTQNIDLNEFSTLFAINKEDAKIFLSFVRKGLDFKEEHIDKK